MPHRPKPGAAALPVFSNDSIRAAVNASGAIATAHIDASPGVLEGLQEESLQHVKVRRQHVTDRLRQLVQYHERELAVVFRLRVLRALSHQVQEL